MMKKEICQYVRKIHRFLNNSTKNTVIFKKHRGYRGMIHFEESERLITLDPRDKVISTLVHEILHDMHPNWSETDILEMERKLINSMSNTQIKNILKKLSAVL